MVLTALLTLLVTAGGVALAAGLGPTTRKMGSGFATVSSCGSLAGSRLSWQIAANNVTGLTITGVPSSCIGAALSVTLVDASNIDIGRAGPITVPASGTVTASSLTANPAASTVTAARIVLTGP